MKAAVIFQRGEMPQFTEDFPDPVALKQSHAVISVRAAAIKHIDQSKSAGRHYSEKKDIRHARVVGGDGVGVLEDGTRIYALGQSGMLAEKAVVDNNQLIKLPDGLDDITAAALPNAIAGSAMALRFRAAMKKGETVLINGATGFTGKVAVQLAKHYGAKRIFVTGRNPGSLESLLDLGADELISLKQTDENILNQIRRLHDQSSPIDVVLDYLWGKTAGIILDALKGTGGTTSRVRFISIGAVTGDHISLSSEILRSTDLQISGSGLGSWKQDETNKLFGEIVPEMFQLAVEHKLKVETITVPLKDINTLWQITVPDGKRLVVTI